MNEDMKIACPNCKWTPDGRAHWYCERCNHNWDTFETAAVCPSCKHAHTHTSCVPDAGGCTTSSRHEDWYGGLDEWLAEQLERIRERVKADV
ncbi:hypothetical protein [Neolewinella antarctica]|uniref:DNA-directed RNA polymerase subunit RPC12/RpoP n=1 Tax=Neolewinella antarctica TaxID=442734 RepID=A0ABX0XA46_9BACT|nr:hypothetical protein [Neolewinella antarctica]NJC25667.1 DNA-directed RNA polymerase subunit RPC12/RpoP [Neolewinella antarctica]